MNLNQIKEDINKGALNSAFTYLYGDENAQKDRYIETLDGFFENYGDRDNIRLFTAPGRTEIGGNHTDHQHGLVLAGSVDLDALAVVSQNNSGLVRIKSKGYRMDVIDLSDLSPQETETGHSASLIRGVLYAFKERGYNIGSFDAYTTSNVFGGSGLSSSAAFEVLVSTIINGLFNGNKVNFVEIAKISQFAEREYFGKPCGLLDQMASAAGGFTFADFNSPENPVVENIKVDFNRSGYTLCVVNTGGSHSDLTDDYADITLECKAVSNALGVEFLRDAKAEDFYGNLAEIRKSCGDRAVLRAMHIFEENERVKAEKQALQNGDFEGFLKQVNASGDSSYKLLQNLYSNKKPTEQALPLALAVTKRFLGQKGACRVHGGGFAGTIQCYIPNEMFAEYKQTIEKIFGENSCIKLSVRPVGGYEIK